MANGARRLSRVGIAVVVGLFLLFARGVGIPSVRASARVFDWLLDPKVIRSYSMQPFTRVQACVSSDIVIRPSRRYRVTLRSHIERVDEQLQMYVENGVLMIGLGCVYRGRDEVDDVSPEMRWEWKGARLLIQLEIELPMLEGLTVWGQSEVEIDDDMIMGDDLSFDLRGEVDLKMDDMKLPGSVRLVAEDECKVDFEDLRVGGDAVFDLGGESKINMDDLKAPDGSVEVICADRAQVEADLIECQSLRCEALIKGEVEIDSIVVKGDATIKRQGHSEVKIAKKRVGGNLTVE